MARPITFSHQHQELNMEETYTFTLTKAQLDIIGTALAELPFKFSAPVLNEINRQFAKQQVAPEPAATE